MPCDSCGHPKASHKEMTLAVYFCSQCQKVESHITFPPEARATSEVAAPPDDILSQLYYTHKAFNKK